MEKAVVVLINHNGATLLDTFLPYVVQYSIPYRVVVIDNSSSDDSVAFLAKHYPTVTCLQHSKNEGFARGYNLALQQIKASYYILLNTDLQPTPHWIDPILQFLETNTAVAACQPKILSYREKHKFEYAGAGGGFIDLLGYPFCRGRLFHSIEADHGQYDDTCEVFWASGACIFLRANAFWKVGGFDERLFAYYEEIDLCWRLQQQGYRIYYYGPVKVYHVGSATFGYANPTATYLKFRNRALVLYKNLPVHFLNWKHGLRLMLDLLVALQACLQGKLKQSYAIIRAQIGFFRYKKYYSPRRNTPNTYRVYQGLIPLAYFVGGKKKFTSLNPAQFSGRILQDTP